MALRLVEGFENYGTVNQALTSTTNFTSRYEAYQSWDIDIDSGRHFGNSIRLGGNWATNQDYFFTPTISPSNATFTVGFSMKNTSRWTAHNFLWARIGASTNQFYLQCFHSNTMFFNGGGTFNGTWAPSGTVVLRRGSDNRVMFYWHNLISDAEWNYYEFKMRANTDATSFIECRKNGVVFPGYNFTSVNQASFNAVSGVGSPVNNLTGQLANSGSAGINRFAFGNIGGYNTQTTWYDDMYILDNSGSFNNDYLGVMAIEAITPIGTGANSNWTPSTGAGWSCIDEAVPNTTDFVSATVTGVTDTYRFAPPSFLNSNVRAIEHNIFMRNNGNLNSAVIPVQRVAGVNYEAPSLLKMPGTLGNWSTYQAIQEVRPEDGNVYTMSNIINREFGLKTTD